MEDKFWLKGEKGEIKINQSKLIKFLTKSGFAKAEISSTDYVLLQESKNTVREIGDYVIVDYIKEFLLKINEPEVYEEFIKGSPGYISKAKLRFLKTIRMLNDRDLVNTSWFHFQNQSWEVSKSAFTGVLRKDIKCKIWESKIIPHNCFIPMDDKEAQFKRFCFLLSGKDENRFKSLCTIIGYLLHRHHDPGNSRAAIFVDENISYDGTANGGTGKSLLLAAIGKCRELVVMDGKNIKTKSWFKNQRINRTTDIVFYDDVGREFSLEFLYSMITTGVIVEKKYKAEEYIAPENSPKICISSNYVVNGTGGSTDIRRRCDFEVANYFNEELTPEHEFGNMFFQDWDEYEWNRFFHFMMGCVQLYFKLGLIIPETINLKQNNLINATSIEFIDFMELELVELDKWICKNTVLKMFIEEYPNFKNLTPHNMTKWMKEWAKQKGFIYEDRKSGKKYEFYLKKVLGK